MKITIIGAGIAGLTTAIALKKTGYDSEVFEAAPSLEPIGAALGLAPNALKALHAIGLSEQVFRAGKRMHYFEIQNRSGKVLSRSERADFGENIAIRRADLHRVLLEEAGADRIHTNKKAVNYKKAGDTIIVEFADGSTHQTDYLIIADGIHSALRDITAPEAKVNYSGYTCWRGIADNPGKEFKGAYEVWDTQGRFGYTPLKGNRIYWYACINAPQGRTMAHFTLDDLQQHFSDFSSSVKNILKATDPNTLFYDDVCEMEPLRRYAYGNILIIGDAAHASTPNMGQGACQAIEDAVVLAKTLAKRPTIGQTFASFEKKRLQRTHYVIRQSAKVGRIAHIQNPFLAMLRDIAMPLIPKSVSRKQFHRLYKVNF